jgi:hypothetical protein
MKRQAQGATLLRLLTIGAAMLVSGGVLLARTGSPAKATAASALEIADKALSGPSLLEDESPYNMIDAIGPSGITQDQATQEVTSRTMMGGLPAPGGQNGYGPYGGGQ